MEDKTVWPQKAAERSIMSLGTILLIILILALLGWRNPHLAPQSFMGVYAQRWRRADLGHYCNPASHR